MKKLFLILVLSFTCFGGLEAQNYWKSIGMQGDFLGVGPDGSYYTYYNTLNGQSITRSQDEGETWETVLGYETGFDCYFNRHCFSVSPEGRVFLFEDYPYRAFFSDDNGETWQTTAPAPLIYACTAEHLFALNNDTIVGVTDNDYAFWTTDGGASWDTTNLPFWENDLIVRDLLVSANGDVYLGLGSYGEDNGGIYHATIADMQDWQLVAASNYAIKDMAFDPEGNVVATVWNGNIGFEHTPGFYLFDGRDVAISENGVVYRANVTVSNTAVLAYSLDHGETFTEIGEGLPLDPPLPDYQDGSLFYGYDHYLYFEGRGLFWKSRCVADDIPGFNPWLGAQFLDEASSLYYSIISTEPPRVSVVGHVDGTDAQGELVIPQTVSFQGSTYTVTKIGYEAFCQCSGLTGNLVIPSTVDTIMTRAFKNCVGFTGDLVIPNSVRYLGGGAFEWCYGFDGSLVLPESIPAIYSYTFEGCTGLRGMLNIPSTVTSIGPAAFGLCTGFTGTLVIPESVVELSTPVPPVNGIRGAFEECTGFTGLVLPESLRIIGGGSGGGCFAYCTGLTGELVIPDKVKEIGIMAFYNCNGLTGELHLPDSLQSIGYEAFYNCFGFTGALIIPNSMEEIGSSAFVNCNGFTELDLGNSVREIGSSAFYGCAGFTGTLTIPDSVTEVMYSAFYNCTGFTGTLVIGNALSRIDDAVFYGCTGFTGLDLGNSVTSIGTSAFYGCTGFTGSLTIPNSVVIIEASAFRNCSGFTGTLTLGDSLESIDGVAFGNCSGFDEVVSLATVPPEFLHGGVFSGISCTKLIVPCGCKTAYENSGWHEYFPTIIEDCGLIGAEWYYEIENGDGSITYQHLEYAADTTVNNKDVVIIIRTNTLYDKGGHTEVTREYVYAEDGIVYWWNSDLQEFTVLYNYDAQEGDAWEIKVGTESVTVHVDAVEMYEYEGRVFRMLRVSDAEDVFSGNIVDGIGHLTSFFPERLMTSGKGYRVDGMRCYWRNGDLFFKYGEEDCDAIYKEWHNGIGEDGPSTDTETFAIYPNPTHGVLVVETRLISSQPNEYRITNLMGQTLMTGTLTTETQQIDVTDLPQGMYFISVGNTARKFVVEK